MLSYFRSSDPSMTGWVGSDPRFNNEVVAFIRMSYLVDDIFNDVARRTAIIGKSTLTKDGSSLFELLTQLLHLQKDHSPWKP